MAIELTILVRAALLWLVLLIVMPIAQRVADFSLPPWPQRMWKLAVVCLADSAVTIGLGVTNYWLGFLAGAFVFWLFLVKWFDVDFFGAVTIAIAIRVVLFLLQLALSAAVVA